jgi:Helix-turn-helix domain
MRRRYVTLSDEQQQALRHCRDHHPLPYMRLKAAAILKVATGQTIKQVALTGLNKPVTQECVSAWISRYEQEGLAGLRVQPGRGRKAAFSPCARERPAQRRLPADATRPNTGSAAVSG